LKRFLLPIFLIALAAPASADVFRILDDPREAAQARVDIIQQAEHDVSALYFLARNDRITLGALTLLRDARRRGVRVRLVVDANFQHIPKAMLAHLRDEGVEVRVYHPLSLRHPSWLFRRMHDKVIVVDGRRYITGGRNLAEAYFGLAKKNYIDRDVYVEGESGAVAQRHFERVWGSHHVAELDVHVSEAEEQLAAQKLDEAHDFAECLPFVQLDTDRDWSHGQKEVSAVKFLSDPIDDGPRVATALAIIIERAKKSIVVESPYLVPSRQVRRLLRKKLKEGVSVLILTNSLRSTDGSFPHAGYVKYRRRLVRAGVDVREYKGPHMLHAKSAVIDGRIALIGSYNLDPRSQNLNTEIMCMVEDEQIAGELRDSIQLHIDNSWTIYADGSRDGAPGDPRVSHAKVIRAWLVQHLLLRLIERQL